MALATLMFLAMIATLIITDNLLEDVDTKNFVTEATAEFRILRSETTKYALDAGFIDRYIPTFKFEISLEEINILSEKLRDLLSSADPGVFIDVDLDPWTYLVPHPDGKRVISFAETGDNFSDIPAEDWLEFLIPICVLFVVMGLGIYYLARKLTKPIDHLSNVASELGYGNFDVRADNEQAKPVTVLANSFNKMADQVTTLLREQQIIIGAIPHELRTPLAKARFALDLTRDTEKLPILKNRIELVDSSLDELDRMVQTTLQLSRLHEQDSIDVQSFNLVDAIHRCLDETDNHANHKIHFDNIAEISSTHIVISDANLLSVAICNLLRNALRHASSTVSIRIKDLHPDELSITVEDDGNGIPSDKLSDVFKPFYRLDESRNRDTGGIGLGLAIVKLITDKLNLNIVASNSELGGAQLVIQGIRTH